MEITHVPSFITRSIVIAATLVAAIASPVAAQPAAEPGRFELGIGYSLLRDAEAEETLVAGWVASAGMRARRGWWLIGEAGGHYKTLADDHQLRVHAFMGGVRYARVTDAAVRPFAQILLGVACYCGSDVSTGTASKSLAIQPGVGLDIPVRDRFALRVQADYRALRDSGETFSQYRFVAGGVISFGGTP
jgi:hypothetical protein